MRKLTIFKQAIAYASPSDTAGLYLVVNRLDKIVYVFDPAFIHLIRYAMATFCTSEMSAEQLALFLAYIDAFNGVTAFTALTSSLDEVLVNLALSIEDASALTCGQSASFEYALIGVDINL